MEYLSTGEYHGLLRCSCSVCKYRQFFLGFLRSMSESWERFSDCHISEIGLNALRCWGFHTHSTGCLPYYFDRGTSTIRDYLDWNETENQVNKIMYSFGVAAFHSPIAMWEWEILNIHISSLFVISVVLDSVKCFQVTVKYVWNTFLCGMPNKSPINKQSRNRIACIVTY